MRGVSVFFVQGGGHGAHDEDRALAEALTNALGPGHEVLFPRMPNEGDPTVEAWKRKISSELARTRGRIVLVAHSIGGSILLRYLSEEERPPSVAGVFLLAAPSWDEDRWRFDDLKLPADFADKLAGVPEVHFYHCRDDEVVPFAHLALHVARLPRAVGHAFETGGHQLHGHLTRVAADMRACVAGDTSAS